MTNFSIAVMLGTLVVMVLFTLVLSLAQKSLRNVTMAFTGYALSTLGWLLSDIAYYLATDEGAVMFLVNLKIPFVATTAVTELILVMRYYRLDRYITRRLKALLCIMPVLVFVMSVTSQFHPLLRREQALVAMDPVHVIHNVRGVGFWVHAAYCYLLTLTSAVIVVRQHGKLPVGYRAPSVVLIFAMLLIVASNAVSIFLEMPFDITALGTGISVLFVYVSIASSAKTDLVEIAKEEIYNSMEECLFIRDLSQQVIDANIAGRRWLEQLGIRPIFPFPFTQVFTVLRQRGATIRENSETAAGTDIYYSHEDHGVVYNLRERFVYDKSDRPVGVYSTLLDVTRYKTIIDRLEKTVEIDPLTGLDNRRVFEELKARFTEEGTLPLGVILGDANGLKLVNDTLGHHQGDALLRVLAQTMRQCCPPGCHIARIGGDEFAMMLPGYTEDKLAGVMHSVRQALAAKAHRYDFTPSIALGAASRQEANGLLEDIDHVVRRADENMYSDKQNDRRGRRG